MHCCPRWSRAQQLPRVFWHLEEVRHPVLSSEYTPGVVAHRPMAWQMAHRLLHLSSLHLPGFDPGEGDRSLGGAPFISLTHIYAYLSHTGALLDF